MKSFSIIVLICFHLSNSQGAQPSCRSNCSKNGTVNDQCWRDALIYRSSELVERLFSFASLSVYVDSFQRFHRDDLNNTIEFIGQSLDNQLINESIDAQVNKTLFDDAKDLLLRLCQNLTITPPASVREFPSLACSKSTCAADISNYLVLFIISLLVSSLILIIWAVQLFQTRRKSTSSLVARQNHQVANSLSTTNTSVNNSY